MRKFEGPGGSDRWPSSTVWDVVRKAATDEGREEALEELAGRYWRPVYAYLRRRGATHEDAADQTQEFFLALVSRDWIRRADEEKGKFRVFLVTLLVRYVRDLEKLRQTRFERRMVRRAPAIVESDAGLLDWGESTSAEEAYWHQYIRDLLDRSMEAFEEVFAKSDPPAHAIFRERIQAGIEGRSLSWADLADRHAFSVDQARGAFDRAAKRFRAVLARALGAEGERESDFRWAVAEMFQMVAGAK